MTRGDDRPVRTDQQTVWHIAIVEGIFVLLAAVVVYFRHAAGCIAFVLPATAQSILGLVSGGSLGALTGFGLMRSRLRGAVVGGVAPLRPIMSATWSIVAVGLMAGVGEELLFRAALQPWIGLWWSAILFGVAHSGTAKLQDGLSIGKVAYLVVAFGAGVLLGMLYQGAGLLASMIAHASFDTAILLVLAPAIVGSADAAPAVKG